MMWKLVVGFVVFAALALYVISKGGDSLDMSGEKHGADSVHVEPAKTDASAPAATSAAPSAAPAPGASAAK